MTMTKRRTKKYLAARVLCTLLLGTYLVGGYGEPVAWGANNEGTAKVAGVENDFHGIVASAWGAGTKAYGRNSTSFGANTVADGHGATAFGGSSMALGFCNTAWGYATQAGQLLYGSDKKVAYIVDYKEGETTKYKIVDYNSEEKKTLKDGFNSYWDAYSECEVKDVDQATAWGSGAKATDWHATAFGFETIASGKRSTAFGQKSEASGESATAWGGYFDGNVYKGGTASGTASTAFGVETIANTKGSTAWGDQTLAGKATIGGTEYSGTYATAFGYGTKASGTYATAFGSLTTASGPVATAWGIGTKASGNRSTAFGDNTIASDFAATAWGTLAIASGKASTAFGSETTASGKASTAFGIYTEATGKGAVAWGVGEKGVGITLAHGESSTAFGKKSRAFGDNSLAALGGITGVGSIASLDGVTWVNFVPGTGEGAVAIGEGATAEASYTYAIGKNAKVLDAKTENAIAIGNDTSVTAVGGVALGSGSVADTENTISVGSSSLQRRIVNVAAGTADTDAVNVAQLKAVAAGATYTAGDGIAISTANEISVKADTSDFDLDSGTLTLKKDGVVASGNKGVVTGGAVYTALAGKADAADLSSLESRVSTNETGIATNKANITTNTTNITKLDNRVTQAETDLSALEGRVTTNEGNIATNKTNITKLNDALYGDTLALGKGSEATGTNSIAIGFGNKVKGNRSGAFGDPTIIDGDDSYSVGNNNEVTGSNTFVLGNNVKTSAKNAVVLGDGSEGVDDAVSVGSKDKKRQIKNVAAGEDDSDAATVGQLKELAGGTGAGMEEVTHRISNLDSKINKVGAGAAALAALHPLDTDNKFTMAAGFGNYRNANAMALGMFYRPTDKVMFSVGGAMGNGENMINAGVSFALDKGVTTSKAAMARTIKAQGDRIAEQDAKIQSLEAYNAKLEERLAALEAKIGK